MPTYGPTQCVNELYLTVANSLALLPMNSNNNKIFQAISNCGKPKGLCKFSSRFLAFSKISNKISTVQKVVLSSSRGQGIFQELEALRPWPRTSKCVLKDVLEAKDVLDDSTPGNRAVILG